MSRSPFARRRDPRLPLAPRRALAVLLTLLTAITGPASLALAQDAQQDAPAPAAATAVKKKSSYNDNVYVIYRDDATGETTCREATPAEKLELKDRDEAGPTRVIYDGGDRMFAPDGGAVNGPQANLTTETGQALQPSIGLRIVLHGTDRLQQNTTARDAFIVAANRWEALISTPITVVLDVDFGPTFFNSTTPFGPNVIGATGTSSQTAPLPSVRSQLISNAPEPEELTLYNALPTSTTPVELNGSTASAAGVRMTWPVARALGLRADITNPDTIPLMQGDAGIGFNSAFNFDFNPNDGISPGALDFDAVVVHEIGHALGFTSESGDGFANPVGILDLFRFRPGAATLANFATAQRVMTEGGSQVFFNNRPNSFGTNEMQLSTGGSDGEGGDGEQSSHWKDDRFTAFIGIMDPTLASGRREVLTSNDLLAFDAFGYKIGGTAPPPPPPPPAPANDNFAAAVVLSGATGSVTGTNSGATREAGEPDPDGVSGVPSVWYRWTAPASGATTFDTIGSDYDTTLGIYTGGAVNALSLACGPACDNDDIVLGQNIQSRVQFTAAAGTTYHIMVNGFDGDSGSIVLNWTAPAAPNTFTISGVLTDGGGNAVPDATVTLDDSVHTTSAANGAYSFSGVLSGNHRLSASKPNHLPNPVFFGVSNSNVVMNITVTPFMSVSGLIRDSQNNPIPGVAYILTSSNLNSPETRFPDSSGAYLAEGVIVRPNTPATFAPVKFGYTFSPASATFTTVANGNQVVNFTGTLNNPIDASAAFVTQQYRDFLGREPDQAGLDFWRNGIETCGHLVACTEVKRVDTSAAFFFAIENQETGVLVYRTHKAAFGDLAGTPIPVRRTQFVADQALIAQNVQVGVGPWQATLEANKVAYFNAFVARAAFTTAFPTTMTPAQFVDKLNQNAEGALSQSERDALVGELTSGAKSRAQVLRAVAEDETFGQSQFRRAFVYMQYVGYLRRDPDAPDFRGIPDPNFDGFNFWLGKLNQFNGSYIDAEMVKAFITSIEYRQRFGQ